MGLTDWLRGRSRSPKVPDAVDLDAPEIFDDPYPLYARLRADAPIVPVRGGGYLLTRHGDIRDVLTRDDFGNAPSRFSALHPRFRETRVAADLASNILPFLDRPEHTEARKLLAAALRKRIDGFESELENIASVMTWSAGGEGDFIADVAGPYTRIAMCRFLGLPDDEAGELAALTDHFFRLFAPLTDEEVLEEVNTGLAAFRKIVRRHRGDAPLDSFLGHLAPVEGSGLTEAQIVDSAVLIFADGVENVATGAATVLATAQRLPAARVALRDGGADAASAVSEALRLDSPAQIIPRIARADVEVLGQRVPEGTPLFLALGSANCDPDVFDSPDTFDMHRNRSQVLTFGAGRHFCLGAGLAEDQMRILVWSALKEGVQVEVPPGGLRYRRRRGHRWLATLPFRTEG